MRPVNLRGLQAATCQAGGTNACLIVGTGNPGFCLLGITFAKMERIAIKSLKAIGDGLLVNPLALFTQL